LTVPVDIIKSRLRYDPETGFIYWRDGKNAGKRAFAHIGKRGYFVSTFRWDGKNTTLSGHRVAWCLAKGAWPSGQIDHINGDRLDNRIANLRDVVSAENARNTAIGKANTSGVIGVYLHKQTGKWCAQINAFGRTVGLGLFREKSDAIIARKAAERVLGYHPNHGRAQVSATTQDKILGETT
jgi:hypothetical protein